MENFSKFYRKFYQDFRIRIEDMHAILFERKMISGAALPKKVDGERLSKIYKNSI